LFLTLFLFHLAGIMFTDYVVTKDGYESQFAVNYLGHFLLTHLLLPRLKAAGKDGRAARVINVSSSAHHFGWFQLSDLQGK
jgi:NAD(P)-dependent dehydrogenase (short-subunit alcohol dehydrogenase family)